MKFLSTPITSEKLEEKGQQYYLTGKYLMFIGVCGIGLLLLVGIICVAMGGDFIDPMIFKLKSRYAFAYIFVVLSYLGIIAGISGISIYFHGLNLFALGRIAHNTEKE